METPRSGAEIPRIFSSIIVWFRDYSIYRLTRKKLENFFVLTKKK